MSNFANILKGNWEQLKGKIKQTWADITDDEIAHIDGEYEELVGTLRKRYGYTREAAEKEANKLFIAD